METKSNEPTEKPTYTAVDLNPPASDQPQKTSVVTMQPLNEQPLQSHSYLDFSKHHPIPGNFIRVDPCCCAFTCTSYDMPKCFGCTTLCKCCCFEWEHYQCKPIQDNHSVCCVFNLFSLELVECFNACKCYYQFLCCEYICGCPLNEAYIDSSIHFGTLGSVPETDIYPWNGTCCFCCGSIDSFYCKLPGCLGCYTDKTVLCCYRSDLCCKYMCWDPNNPKKNLYCIGAKHRSFLIQPVTLCKIHRQLFCCDHRCACPYDDNVPCMYMFPCTFATICVNYRYTCKFCLSYADIQVLNSQSEPSSRKPDDNATL